MQTNENILCCLSGAPSNGRVIRAAARMGQAFGSGFTALYVESPGAPAASSLRENLRLAEELGGRIITVYGDDPAVQIAEYARISGATKIVLGLSPRENRWRGGRSLIDRLGVQAPELDLYVIPDAAADTWYRRAPAVVRERFTWPDFLRTVGILALCTLVGRLFVACGISAANAVMVYILGVLAISMVTTGRSYSLLATAVSVLIYNYFFTAPYYSLRSDPDSVATFAVMFIVALLGSTSTARIKQQAEQSARKAYRTEILLQTSQKLQKAEDTGHILDAAADQLRQLLECDMVFYLSDGTPRPYPVQPGADLSALTTDSEQALARWVLAHNHHAGRSTAHQPQARCLYLAVRGSRGALAAVGLAVDEHRPPDSFEKSLMFAILDECGLALEKDTMVREKQQVEQTARQEALRADLLRSISHDLRTPLTSISGNAAILMERGEALTADKRRSLAGAVYDDAQWLINLVENLLSITRIENGTIRLNRQPELLDDIFQEALAHLDRAAERHHIAVELPDDLLMAEMDARLIVQVLINLLNNAIKYTPEGSRITLSARAEGGMVRVSVADDGPGIREDAKPKLFQMFYTEGKAGGDSRRGLGLGLALCRSIVNAHGGAIGVADNPPHGSCFTFTLPVSEVIPHE